MRRQPPTFRVEFHAAEELASGSLRDEVVDVYRAAFTAPPWNETAEQVDAFRERLPGEAQRSTFRLAVARSGNGAMLGFATAWTTPSPFPTTRMYTAIAEAIDAEAVRDRFIGCTEVDELAVRPDASGAGIGRRLLNTVAPVPGPPAWLVTKRSAEAAVALYRSSGWEEFTAMTPAGAELVVFATPTPARSAR